MTTMKLFVVMLVIACVVAEDLSEKQSTEVEGRRRHRFGNHHGHHLSYDEEQIDYEYDDDYDDVNYNVRPIQNRISDPYGAIDFFPNNGFIRPTSHYNHNYAGVYGLHALWVIWAIKIKIFFVAFAIGAFIFYGLKVWAGAKLFAAPCPEIGPPVYHETPYNNVPFEHSGFDHSHSDAIYSSYPGPEPYHAQPAYDSTGYASESSYPPSVAADAPTSLASDHQLSATPETYNRRVSKQKRSIRSVDERKEWLEIGFLFLGVNSMACRKRFICEMDFKSRTNPVTGMMFKFAAENLFNEYRTIEEVPQIIDDCARIHSECVHRVDSSEDASESIENTNEVTAEQNEAPVEPELRKRTKRVKKNRNKDIE